MTDQIPKSELDDLRIAILQKGAQWTASETSVSRLNTEVRRQLLLAAPPIRTEVPKSKIESLAPLHLPLIETQTSFDWRNVNGKSYVTPVRMQVGGTCVAFANTAAVESCVLCSETFYDNNIDLSEHVLSTCNSGYPSSVAEFLLSTGLPSEACYPWSAGDPSAGWQDQTYKVIEHKYYKFLPISDVKKLIASVGPIVTGMNIPTDFYNYKGGIYTATTTSIDGFHEVLVVGYNDKSQCFICKNSWGEDWGESGFFRIAYSQFGQGTGVDFGCLVDTYRGIVPPRRRTMAVPIALKTINGHTLTIVNGGGLGGPNTGPNACAIHTDAIAVGPWETFTLEWLDSNSFAIKTVNGTYITAVGGGGVGGPNDSSCPVHTDASWVGPWELLTLNYDAVTGTATIQTANGRYLTASNGGGIGGQNNVPIHTDAKNIGPWEKFTAVLAH